MEASASPAHLQDALLLALDSRFSRQDGQAVSADFVHLVAVVFERDFVV